MTMRMPAVGTSGKGRPAPAQPHARAGGGLIGYIGRGQTLRAASGALTGGTVVLKRDEKEPPGGTVAAQCMKVIYDRCTLSPAPARDACRFNQVAGVPGFKADPTN
jgi:hypothetical protein